MQRTWLANWAHGIWDAADAITVARCRLPVAVVVASALANVAKKQLAKFSAAVADASGPASQPARTDEKRAVRLSVAVELGQQQQPSGNSGCCYYSTAHHQSAAVATPATRPSSPLPH